MAENIALKVAIWQSKHKRAIVVARLAKIHESRFSKIINGHLPASEDERKRIARVLGKSVDELFGVAA